MSPERVKQLHDARPFHPFKLRLGDGTVVPVPHPELMAIFPGGRTLVVTSRDKLEIIDVFLVTAVEMATGNGSRRRKAG